MQTLADFFERINEALGVSTPTEMLFSPYFIGLCVVIFIYALYKGWKPFYLAIGALMGFALLHRHLYPESSSDLTSLIYFLGACALWALVLIYLGFVKD
jgi:hypothetical protein